MPLDETRHNSDELKIRSSVNESSNNQQTDSESDSCNIFDIKSISELEENDSD